MACVDVLCAPVPLCGQCPMKDICQYGSLLHGVDGSSTTVCGGSAVDDDVGAVIRSTIDAMPQPAAVWAEPVCRVTTTSVQGLIRCDEDPLPLLFLKGPRVTSGTGPYVAERLPAGKVAGHMLASPMSVIGQQRLPMRGTHFGWNEVGS